MTKKICVLLALAAGVILPATSRAITIKIDEPDPTVTRLSSGYADVVYTGTITLTDGYELFAGNSNSLWNAAGDPIAGIFPVLNYGANGTLFTLRYDATDFGLYAFDFSLLGPAYFGFSECQIGGGFCNNASGTFSLNIVDSVEVPEPATFTLLGAGLLALIATRRRRLATRPS